jgi:hypothetical protein
VYVRVQVALGGGQRSVAGDPSQDVELDACVGEPGQAGVPEVVAAQVFVAELGDHIVPVGGVAQDGGGDASAARARDEAGVGVGAGRQDALGDGGRIDSLGIDENGAPVIVEFTDRRWSCL